MTEVYARLRRMTGTTDLEEEFSDTDLQDLLDLAEVKDSEGRTSEDEEWEPTYDLNRAASLVWAERAALISRVAFDSQVDMTKASRSQIVDNFYKMARYYQMRSKPEFVSPFSAFEA